MPCLRQAAITFDWSISGWYSIWFVAIGSDETAACRRHGISVTAYCPIARGKVVDDPVIVGIAKTHGRTPAQVALKWLIQQPGVIAIPRTSSKARLAENLDIDGFELLAPEMDAIAGLAHAGGRLVNVAWSPKWD